MHPGAELAEPRRHDGACIRVTCSLFLGRAGAAGAGRCSTSAAAGATSARAPVTVPCCVPCCSPQDAFIPNPALTSPATLAMFEYIGKIMGIAIRQKSFLPFRFPSIVRLVPVHRSTCVDRCPWL